MKINFDRKCIWCGGKTRTIYRNACDACTDKRIQEYPARVSQEGIPIPAGVRCTRLLVFDSLPVIGLIYCDDDLGPQYLTAVSEEYPDGDKCVAIWQDGQLLFRGSPYNGHSWADDPALQDWMAKADANEPAAQNYRAAQAEAAIERVWAH